MIHRVKDAGEVQAEIQMLIQIQTQVVAGTQRHKETLTVCRGAGRNEVYTVGMKNR